LNIALPGHSSLYFTPTPMHGRKTLPDIGLLIAGHVRLPATGALVYRFFLSRSIIARNHQCLREWHGGSENPLIKGIYAMKALKISVLLIVLSLFGQLYAQAPVPGVTRQAKLQALSEKLQQRDIRDRQSAEVFARHAGIPMRRILPGDRVLELQRIAAVGRPVFYITNNIVAADTVSTDEVWPGGLGLDGSGMTMAEWDGGAVYADHFDLAGRVIQVDGATEISGHSTHVAGTLIGSGVLVIDTRGMAYAANLKAYDWNSDTAEMATAAAAGQLVSNHSYGVAAGWLYMGDTPPDRWWWIGGPEPSDLEDTNFGYYDAESQLWDQIAVDAPFYLIVKAAGNDRVDWGPDPGEEYTIIDQDGEFISTSKVERPSDCAPEGYDCLPTHSVAKNILTVGAVEDLPGGYLHIGGPGQVKMTPFSGWGPTDDGRIKPDLVGNGAFLFSAWSPPDLFGLAAGTSQAAPNVSGSLLLLQEHYQDLNGPGNFMRAATLKALAIHTADEAGTAPGPDYVFGWGLLNTLSAARLIGDSSERHQVIETSLDNKFRSSYAIHVNEPDSIVKATLVWADPPGSPPEPALDPADLMLVNDLDMRIVRGVNSWLPWTLDPANPSAAATTGDNFRDNVEQVTISSADTCSYNIEIGHKGTLLDGAAQDYSLIISVEPPPPAGTLVIDEDFSVGLPTGWTVSTPQGVAWTVNTPVPGDERLDNYTGGSGRYAMVDNNTAVTETMLRTAVIDLSDAVAVVLRFSSYYFFDELETISVDVSTDGGGNWTEGWRNAEGNIHDPYRIVVDLSDFIARQSNVMLQFHFNSNGAPQGNLWQIDDIQLEAFEAMTPTENLPFPASEPIPADGASGVEPGGDIGWTAGLQTNSHDVYFGTAIPLGAGEFRGNQAGVTYDPGPLEINTTYYWRVDEVNAEGIKRGCTWSFTTQGQLSGIIFSDGFEGDGYQLPLQGGKQPFSLQKFQ
jgi:hypothetical protein